MKKILCWWFGCREDPGCPYAPNYCLCVRCGNGVPYGDLVGDTRHNRFKQWAEYWFFRKWIPEKCEYCGRRWKRCEEVDDDHIPF